MRRPLAALCLAVAVGSTGTARAEGVPRELALELVECVPAPLAYDELRTGLEVELAHAGVASFPTPTPSSLGRGQGRLEVEVSCDPSRPEARLTLEGPEGRRAAQVIELADVRPALWARTISLFAAEVMQSTWPQWMTPPVTETAEAEAEPGSASAPTPSPPAAPTVIPESRPPPPAPAPVRLGGSNGTLSRKAPDGPTHRTITLYATPTLEHFPSPPTWQRGAASGVGVRRFDLGLSALAGSHEMGALLSSRFSFDLGWRVVERALPSVYLAIVPRLRLGVVAAWARPRVTQLGYDRSAPYADATVGLVLGVPFARRCTVALTSQVGAARGFLATADGRRIAAFDGLLFGAGLETRCGIR
ncbi:MAG: hypothetical protein JW751_17420 [Polyangiaceae bacterium]|nr:hypothetical protein [Polyangiaceae bacterium]